MPSGTPTPPQPASRLAAAIRERSGRAPRCLVVHEGPALATTALRPSAETADLATLLDAIAGGG